MYEKVLASHLRNSWSDRNKYNILYIYVVRALTRTEKIENHSRFVLAHVMCILFCIYVIYLHLHGNYVRLIMYMNTDTEMLKTQFSFFLYLFSFAVICVYFVLYIWYTYTHTHLSVIKCVMCCTLYGQCHIWIAQSTHSLKDHFLSFSIR